MIVIVTVGFVLRLFHLTLVPLRGDEAFSVQYWAGQPLSVSLAKTATIEPHPLLTYAIFRGWGLIAGTSELAMRFLPALIGLLGIPAIFAIGKRLGNKQIGLVAALLFALHPFEIWHAQDVRNYAIWAGMSLIALWLGLRALDKQRNRDWLLYAVVASVAANIFYMELLTIAAFGIYVLITYWGKWKTIFLWSVAAAIAGGLSIASFVIFQLPLFMHGGYPGSVGGALNISEMWTHFLPVLNFGEITLPLETLDGLWSVIAIVLLSGLVVLWLKQRRMALWLTLLALLPPIFLTVLSTRLSVFAPRYILSVAPAFLLIFASLIVFLYQQKRSIIAPLGAVILLSGWLVISGASLRNYYFDPAYAKTKNWPVLAHYLQQNSQPDDVIIQSAADSAFGYYYHQNQMVEAPDVALPATPTQPTADIRTVLEKYSQQKTAIWQVGQEFSEWPNAGIVKGWLDEHMQLVLSGAPGGLNMLEYKNWQVATDEIAHTTSATFANVVNLISYKILPPSEPNGNMTVWLYWKPLTTTGTPLKVFVHLLGATNPATNSPLWTQDDRFPQNGRISSQNWSTAETYRDVYTVPMSGVPNGQYTLEVGLYDPTTNTRLKVGAADSYILQTIELK
ncbi:MAG: glycosyltransferase family 39 protein [Anaerolineae bacterium]|nr:glycosyltransferase family 39 protein [Anaerolineae bacterium]